MGNSSHPRADPQNSGSGSRLDSWKEIALHLGRSEKTVRRWEENQGLPVHRLHHEKRASVYAYSDELEQWRQTRKTAVQCEPPDKRAEICDEDPPAPARRQPGSGSRVWLVTVAVALAVICGIALLPNTYLDCLRYLFERKPGLVQIQSLAVLPFKNMSNEVAEQYFADGITEQLITELARTSPVRIISRTSVMRYKDTKRSVPEIAKELNVDSVVQGSVERSGSRVRISVQLVTPSAKRHLWADMYEGDIRDVLDLQGKAARDLSSEIGAKVTSAASPRSGKRPGPETYETYLRARHFLARRDAESMKKALAYFQRVVEREPEYGPAYAGLAITYDVLGSYEVLRPENSFPKAQEAASKALQLDNTLAEAYAARAMASSFWEFDWSAADLDFRRAIALDGNSALAHHWYAENWISIGKPDRALAEMKLARELDPLSLAVNGTLGRVYRDARKFGEALEQCRKTLDLDPNFTMGHWCLGQVYIGEHRYEAAIQELELANTLGATPLIDRDLAWANAAVGNKAKAKAILHGLVGKARSEYLSPYSIAVVHAALKENDDAFRWLERAFIERDCHVTYLALDPEVDPLRSDPRFKASLERLKIRHCCS